MANKFTRFLQGFGNGLTSPKGLVSNWQHATRLFIDDTMRLAPKHKFNYYVHFDFDKMAVKAPGFSNKHMQEAGILVKTCDLPKFSFDLRTLEQYNRKKKVYTNINYDPITFTMHDDNNGVINALWAIYYGYYVKDRSLPQMGFNANHYRKSEGGLHGFRYGLDNNRTSDIFRSISIYTMGRRRFTGYTLINPKIAQWQHGNRDHSASTDMAESTMTVEYEAVQYSAGKVSYGTPTGFATLHYDTTPSPLSVAGGGVSNLLGDGGVLDGIEQVFGAFDSGAAFSSPAGFLSTVAKGINTYKNFKNLNSDSLLTEGLNVLQTPGAINTIGNGVTGLIGSVFPKNPSANTTTSASAKPVTNNQWVNPDTFSPF